MADKPRVQSPEVIAKAERFKVDLTQVRASGEGGVITGDDVFRTALANQLGLRPTASVPEIMGGVEATLAGNKRRKEAAAAAASEAASRASIAASVQAAARSVSARGPAWALNPRVDQVRAEAAAGQTVMPTAPAPTLFASGDLPSFTASGIPPAALLDVPTMARHAMAAASTPAEAYAIASECNGPGGTDIAQMSYSNHDGNQDYEQRVQHWQTASMSDAQLYNSIMPGAADEQRRRDAVGLSAEEEAAIDAQIQRDLGI